MSAICDPWESMRAMERERDKAVIVEMKAALVAIANRTSYAASRPLAHPNLAELNTIAKRGLEAEEL